MRATDLVSALQANRNRRNYDQPMQTPRRHIDDKNAWKLATFLRMDAPTVMAYMAEDRARDAETKEFWRHKLPRLLPSVAIASAGLWALGGALTDGAQSATTQLIDTTRYTLCEVRRRLEKRARPAPAFGC